jgi:hypothetical protein
MRELIQDFLGWLPTYYAPGIDDRLRVLENVTLPAGGLLTCLSYLRVAETPDAPASFTVDLWTVRPARVLPRAVDDMCRNLEDVGSWIDAVVEDVEMRRGEPSERPRAEVRGNVVGTSVAPHRGVDQLVLGGRRLRLWTCPTSGARRRFEPYVPSAAAFEGRRLAPLRRELAGSVGRTFSQRRRWPRRKVRMDGRLDVLGERGEVLQSSSVRLRDLSVAGSGFVGPDLTRLPSGASPPSIRLWLSGGMGRACRLSGELVRVMPWPGGTCGVRFNALSPLDRRALQEILEP